MYQGSSCVFLLVFHLTNTCCCFVSLITLPTRVRLIKAMIFPVVMYGCEKESEVWLFATSWTVAYQAPPSMGFSRQEFWSGLPFPSPGDLPNPGIEPRSPALQADALLSEPPGKLMVESWTIKKAECQRIDALELWCWRRLLGVPWTAQRSNQSILKEISPEYSLEGLRLKLKLQYFGHLMWRTHSLEKTLMLGKSESRKRRG